MITGDGGVQIHRGQGRVPKVLQQNAGKEAGKTWNIICVPCELCFVLSCWNQIAASPIFSGATHECQR